MPNQKPSALASIVAGGRGGSPPSPAGPPPPGEMELAAAQEFASAIASGNPAAIVESYRALKEACEASY